MRDQTLPTDSAERKQYPLMRGLFAYFPAALAGVAHHSFISNAKHNPGKPLQHSRHVSNDHLDCLLRHVMDLQTWARGTHRGDINGVLYEVNAMAWRALAVSQEVHESLGAPVAPAATFGDSNED